LKLKRRLIRASRKQNQTVFIKNKSDSMDLVAVKNATQNCKQFGRSVQLNNEGLKPLLMLKKKTKTARSRG
jgi:hypothetical protein